MSHRYQHTAVPPSPGKEPHGPSPQCRKPVGPDPRDPQALLSFAPKTKLSSPLSNFHLHLSSATSSYHCHRASPHQLQAGVNTAVAVFTFKHFKDISLKVNTSRVSPALWCVNRCCLFLLCSPTPLLCVPFM